MLVFLGHTYARDCNYKIPNNQEAFQPPFCAPKVLAVGRSGFHTILLMRMKHYAFADYATQGYMTVAGVRILLLHGDAVPMWPRLLVAHGAGIASVHALIRARARYPFNRLLASGGK